MLVAQKRCQRNIFRFCFHFFFRCKEMHIIQIRYFDHRVNDIRYTLIIQPGKYICVQFRSDPIRP